MLEKFALQDTKFMLNITYGIVKTKGLKNLTKMFQKFERSYPTAYLHTYLLLSQKMRISCMYVFVFHVLGLDVGRLR